MRGTVQFRKNLRHAQFPKTRHFAAQYDTFFNDLPRPSCHGYHATPMLRYTPLLLLAVLLTGCGIPSFLITPVQNVSELQEITVRSEGGWGTKKIAIVDVEGMLMDAKVGGFLQPQENKVSLFVQQLETIADDASVKAVILRVNSPGGTVTGSNIMYEELLRFKEKTKKPVIVSTQEVCASGAYYLSCGADEIIVEPTTVIGSIGVVFETFNFSGTMMKIGASSDAIKSGKYKDMGSPFRPVAPDERAIMQGLVDEYYKRFVSIVNKRHKLDPEIEIKATDGRVFSGVQAVELGLADKTGSLEDAIEEAKKKADIKSAKVIMYKRPYGYSGSIYASAPMPPAQSQSMTLNLPLMRNMLPTGFYYLWNPE